MRQMNPAEDCFRGNHVERKEVADAPPFPAKGCKQSGTDHVFLAQHIGYIGSKRVPDCLEIEPLCVRYI